MASNNQYGPQWNAKIKGIEAAMQRTQSGKPMLVVECEVLDGEHKGQRLQYRGLLNPENVDQTDRTIKAMECLGCSSFRNDPFSSNAFSGLGRSVARGILTMDTDQNGNERMIIRFVNPDTLIREDAVATETDRDAWRKQFANVMKVTNPDDDVRF